MPKCAVCDSETTSEQKTCHVCGSPTANESTSGSAATSQPTFPLGQTPNVPPLAPTTPPAFGTDRHQCPACGRSFDASFTDEFCPCGTELVLLPEPEPNDEDDDSGILVRGGGTPLSIQPPSPVPLAPIDFPFPLPAPVDPVVPTPISISVPISPSVPVSITSAKPAAGTACLVLYSDTKPRQPLKYYALNKDVTLVGRLDAVNNAFPDIDLASQLDDATAKKVSRKHAEILRSRETQTFRLRVIPGSTGTQVGKELAAANQEIPLTDGTPIVLGGGVWLKFETMK